MFLKEENLIFILLVAVIIHQVCSRFHMLFIESTSSAAGEVPDAPSVVVQDPEDDGDGRPKWKGKGKAIVPRSDSGTVSNSLTDNEPPVDWTQYDPPEGLKDPAGCTTDIVIQVMNQSIDRVKARIVEEAERREAEEEVKKLRQEEICRQENQDASYAEALNLSLNGSLGERGVSLDLTEASLPERPPKSTKSRLMILLRRLNNIGEKGESSAAGASRHKRDVSWNSIEQSTQAARKRIVFEVLKRTTTNSSGNPSVHNTEIECVSCLDDFKPKEMIKAPCHSYCKPCFMRLITTACENEQQWPPKCCLNAIPSKTILDCVNDGLKKIYRAKAAEWSIPVSERVYCSRANCSLWIPPDHINRARSIARCSAGHGSCTICRGPQHDGDECPQDRDMMRTDELAEAEGWKRCYGCHAYVEHREACQHMTCRCGAEFCYVCGARWRTCDCSMEQLAAVKRGADERRQARRDREALEEAELQQALRLVAEFQREEALKAELLQRERERIADERRAKRIEERIKHEGERRRLVELKFQELREVFANLHDIQRVEIQYTHSKEQADLEKKGATALAEFQESWRKDHEKLKATAKAKLSEMKEELKREEVARIIWESRIEEQYQAELKAYWSRSRKPDREEQAEAAMKELKRKMDESFKKWEKRKDNELDTYRWCAMEELGIQVEHMEVEKRRLVENAREEKREFERRKNAELRWVDSVIEERDRMLNDMEIDEIENGENVDAWFEDDALDDVSIEDIDIEIPQVMTQGQTPRLGLFPSLIWSNTGHT